MDNVSVRSGRDRGRTMQKQVTAPRSRSSSAQRDATHRFSDGVAKLHAAQLAIGAISKQATLVSSTPAENNETVGAQDLAFAGTQSSMISQVPQSPATNSARKSKLLRLVERAKQSNQESERRVEVERTEAPEGEQADAKDRRLLENVQFERTLLAGQEEVAKVGPKSLLSAKDATIQSLRKRNAKLESHADELTQKLAAVQRDLKMTSVRELSLQSETYFAEILRLRAQLSRPQQIDASRKSTSDNGSQTDETGVKAGEHSRVPSDKPPLPAGNSSRRSSAVPDESREHGSSPQNSNRAADEQVARLRSMNDTLMKANAERIKLLKENGALKKERDSLAMQLQAAQRPPSPQRRNVFMQTAVSAAHVATQTQLAANQNSVDLQPRLAQLELENTQLKMRVAEYEVRVRLDLKTFEPTKQQAETSVRKRHNVSVETESATAEKQSTSPSKSTNKGPKSGFLSVLQHTLTEKEVSVLQNALAAYRTQRTALCQSKAETERELADAVASCIRSHRVRKAFVKSHTVHKPPARRRRNVVMNGVDS